MNPNSHPFIHQHPPGQLKIIHKAAQLQIDDHNEDVSRDRESGKIETYKSSDASVFAHARMHSIPFSGNYL